MSGLYSYWSIFLLCMQCFVVFFPEWFKMTDFDPLFGSKLMVRKGIWLKCVRVSPGVHNCDAYLNAINDIPMFLMWSRVNSILGLVCHLSSISVMLYVQLGSNVSSSFLQRASKISGWLLLSSGVFITSAITSVAFVIAQGWRYRNDQFNSWPIDKVNYIFGCCIYMGWIQSTMAIVFGVFILCGKTNFDDHQLQSFAVESNNDQYRQRSNSKMASHRSLIFKNPPPPMSNPVSNPVSDRSELIQFESSRKSGRSTSNSLRGQNVMDGYI